MILEVGVHQSLEELYRYWNIIQCVLPTLSNTSFPQGPKKMVHSRVHPGTFLQTTTK